MYCRAYFEASYYASSPRLNATVFQDISTISHVQSTCEQIQLVVPGKDGFSQDRRAMHMYNLLLLREKTKVEEVVRNRSAAINDV